MDYDSSADPIFPLKERWIIESGNFLKFRFSLKSSILSTDIEAGNPNGVENGRGEPR
jgi:hypothetical protein